MKKVILGAALASTMLTGVAQAADLGAGAYSSALTIRDSLITVYDDLADGTVGGWAGRTTTHGHFSELLYRIDNLGDRNNINPFGINLDDDGHLALTGGDGDITQGYSVDEVVASANQFVDQVNNNLFHSQGTVGTGDRQANVVGEGNQTGYTLSTSHLATNRLNTIITELNRVNGVIADDDQTSAAKEAARDGFRTFFAEQSVAFNNAVDALDTISSNIGSWTTATTEDTIRGYAAGADFRGRLQTGESYATVVVQNLSDGVTNFNTYGDYVANNTAAGTPVFTRTDVGTAFSGAWTDGTRGHSIQEAQIQVGTDTYNVFINTGNGQVAGSTATGTSTFNSIADFVAAQ